MMNAVRNQDEGQHVQTRMMLNEEKNQLQNYYNEGENSQDDEEPMPCTSPNKIQANQLIERPIRPQSGETRPTRGYRGNAMTVTT